MSSCGDAPLEGASRCYPLCGWSITYPVYSSAEEVPEEVFANTSLVIEKFMPKIDGDDYWVRYACCLEKAEVSLRLWSKEKVVKGANANKIEEVPTPVGIDAMPQQLGFDYGKLDYVMPDGKLVLLDANRTPAATTLQLGNFAEEFACHLARGIWSRLDM